MPVVTRADLRAERHARTFTPKQAPRDPEVERLMAEGYVAQQIASILKRPLIDVRLAIAVCERASLAAECAANPWRP